MLEVQPICFDEACEYIRLHHRHHNPPQGWKWGFAINDGFEVVGVVAVGRPVARAFDDGWTLEITRCCGRRWHWSRQSGGAIEWPAKNVVSKLYAAVRRAAWAMGYRRVITYTMAGEPGASLRGAGYRMVAERRAKSWHAPSRPRVDKPGSNQARQLWLVKNPPP